jgi:flagellar assembly factor FliW
VSRAVADCECRTALQSSAPSVLYFAQGLPGFDELRRWELIEREEARPFLWLRAVERPQVALLVVNPRELVGEYQPHIPAGVWSRLGAGSEDRSLTFVVVSLSRAEASVNLRAPLLIDPQTMRGEQALLDDGDWPVRFGFAPPAESERQPGTGRSPACSSSAAR